VEKLNALRVRVMIDRADLVFGVSDQGSARLKTGVGDA
jgi:hypothetical protein